jgi:hypothetical protein
MRAIQGAFYRLTKLMLYEEHGDRLNILQCMVLLYNFRLKNVGLNQLQTVYIGPFARSGNQFMP